MDKNNNVKSINDSKESFIKDKNNKPLWKMHFNAIPEVLTVSEVAEYLRIKENIISNLINEDSIKTIPGTNETRIFKGFLYAFLTQNPPKQIGLLGGMPNQDQENLNIGF